MSGRRLIPVVPTALTLGNLVCGFLAMAKLIDALQLAPVNGGPLSPLFGERVLQACWLLIAGMIFDALDGRVARLMKASSAFGVQLDSLADVVSFGLAPALMAKVVYEHTMRSLDLAWRPGWVTTLCALYLMGAALRLARFNVAADSDEKSHDVFMGLPSPAAALTIVTTCFFIFDGRTALWLAPETIDAVAVGLLRALPGMAALLGLLMVSRVRYVHLFQRYVKQRTRVGTAVRMFLVAWLVAFFHEWSLFVGALLYVIGGLVLWLLARARGRSPVDSLPPPWDEDDDGPETTEARP
ncbi:MAG: CDP-alcohol phosphatidyltransferase family protein [Planctomycetota bacterium]